jgi:glucose-6-phosphate isomerase
MKVQNHHYFEVFPKDEDIFEKIVLEKAMVGYYDLPSQDIGYLQKLDRFTQKNIVVVGIGGSSLGTYAICDFLGHSSQKDIIFLESTDPLSLKAKLDSFDVKDAVYVVISKSGTTIETIAILKYLHHITHLDRDNTIIVSEVGSSLYQYTKKFGLDFYEIAKNIGGRFSVLSSVGLVPLYLLGYDISLILKGASSIAQSFFAKEKYHDILMKKARFISENKDKYNINALFSYTEALSGFNKWYIQLWGESLGKIDEYSVNKGLTPIGLLGPVDQHSFLQLIVEGKRDKTLTFIKIKDFQSDITIPHKTIEHLQALDILNGLDFATLINLQADATIESVKNLKDIPVDVIELENTTEYEIGKLMYYYMLLTSLVAKFVGIDAYNQPGVELGKVILKEKLKEQSEKR